MSSRRIPLFAALASMTMLPAAAPAYPPRTLILLVAAWCGSCRVELKQLDAIVAAAAPIDVRVLPIDRSAATAAMLRDVPAGRIWRSARAVDALTQQGGSLPFTVMTDSRGRPCATHDRAVDAAEIQAMRRRCERD